MGQQQLLLIILGVIIVGIAVAVGITMFQDNAVDQNRKRSYRRSYHVSGKRAAILCQTDDTRRRRQLVRRINSGRPRFGIACFNGVHQQRKRFLYNQDCWNCNDIGSGRRGKDCLEQRNLLYIRHDSYFVLTGPYEG